MKHKIIFTIIIILFSGTAFSNNDIRYGLGFNAYEVEKEERTGLYLTSEGTFSFSDGFIMEFEVEFRKVFYNFGYIFRIIDKNSDNHIDLVLHRTENSNILEPQLNVIFKSGETFLKPTFNDLETDFHQWMPVKLMIDRRKGIFKLTINGKEYEKTDEYFKEFKNVDIIFGKNNHINYETSDVPSMCLRDIFIKKLDGKKKFHWKLSQYTENGVLDEIKGRYASCENPDWLLNNHVYWKKVLSFTTRLYPQICYNPDKNEIGITDKNTFYTINLNENKLTKDSCFNGFPSGSKANQLFYDKINHKYFTYNFTDEVAYYNAKEKSWNNLNEELRDPVYWHHNRFYSTGDTSMYTFNGYGFHTYRNHIHRYSFSNKTWEILSYAGDTINPRYLGGLGVIDDKNILFFGGYGSESGRQEHSPRNYYDLYIQNIETLTTQKIWEFDPSPLNFAVVNSLIVDTIENCFYAMCFSHQKFNTKLQLYRFSMDQPSYETIGDDIPYFFNDNHSFADIYLTNDSSQLISILSYTDEKKSNSTIQVYSLAFPPLSQEVLLQSQPKTNYTLFIIVFGILLITPSGIIIMNKKRITQKARQTNEVLQDETEPATSVKIKPLKNNKNKQTIILLGGFEVRDKAGNIVTGEFTPILKQLFLLMLLNTLKNGKGISSEKLREILWYDKSKESAKNNRGVSISKLRQIFEKIGDISIDGSNSYWTINFGENIYCDYYESIYLMEQLITHPKVEKIKRLLSVVSSGELLPNVQTEWVDPFKSNFSNKLIDLLLNIISNPNNLNLNPALKIEIADAIFVHDSLNEDALKIKCSILVEMGKNGLAQKTYASFIKEYQSLFGVEFKHSFEEIIS